ncbi:hypothetical protein UFOVP1169_3 [uncultured Caudovirales phage]|uniref:Uncharacterized protein n=1 Tax=uncultured Caudovirales phage TaxID=2100421 RepID=A0A6J5QT71_9CAUD|nr:hypothetical protein UFOVP1169_3 [uncultured Caudovirales phage]
MANQMQEPYTPQSRLLAQLLAKRHQPVQSVGQGIADVIGDLGSAYFQKSAMNDEEAKSQDKASKLAQIVAMTVNPQTSQSNIDVQAGNFKQAQPAFPNGAPPDSAAMMNGAAPVPAQGAFPQGYTKPVSTEARALAGIQAVGRDAPEMSPLFSTQARSIAKSLLPPPQEISYAPAGSQPIDKRTGAPVGSQVPFAPKEANKTHLNDLLEEHKALDPADPLRKIYEQAISKEVAQTGMRISTNPDGTFEITTGGLEPGLTKPTETKLEDTIINGRDTLAKMNQIKTDFKPEYQQIGTRAEMMKYEAMSKAGMKLDEGAQKKLTDFATYRRNAASNINTAIKNATGVTVGKDEAPRLMNEIPNPGSGLFDGDDPISFMAKVDSTTKAITSAVARAAYARKNGLDKQQQFAIPLDSIPSMIEQKGNQYAEQLQRANPQTPLDQIKEMVKGRLREEFGL